MNTIERILTLVDFGDSGSAALLHGSTLAEELRAELHLLHVVGEQTFPRLKSRGVARKELQELAVPNDDLKICREIRQGPVIESAVQYVEESDIDLVVLDKSGTGQSSERAFKRVVNQLMDALDCPVLVVPQQEDITESALISKAADILRNHFGDELAGGHHETLTRMQDVLARNLNLSTRDADTLFAQLEKTQAVQWRLATSAGGNRASTSGTWQIRVASDDAIDFAPASEELEASMAVRLLRRAMAARATDIHIDPGPVGYIVRFRIDGRMQEYCRIQGDMAGSLIKQIKLLANVSLSDPFQPSESRLQIPKSMPNFEVRITTAPVPDGQAIALRLIDRDKLYRPLNELGFSANSFTAIYQMLHRPAGLILVTGPTGAGKTTTAYSMLNVLFTQQQNIISIEDPVELLVPFMRQLNVDRRHGFTMKVGLSTLLRMDPDVVFVGEIRDSEAAQVAMQAASSGKRVFSTMHMRDVAAAVTAMRELDIDLRSLADNLTGIITQRLVRRLCTGCRENAPITKHEEELFASQNIDVQSQVACPRGCHECRDTGYKNRIGVFEAAVMDGEITGAVRQGKSEAELRDIIRAAGTPSLAGDGLLKVRDGVTTIQEVLEMSWQAEPLPIPQPRVQTDEVYERGVPYKRAL